MASDIGEVYIADETRRSMLAGEAQLRDLVADGVTEEQGDGLTALPVQGVLQSTGNGVLARVNVTGKENGETLRGTKGV